MDGEDRTFLRDSYQMLQSIKLQNNNVYLSPPANRVIKSDHYVNGRECNSLAQLSEIASQSSSQNYGFVGEQCTNSQEINENEMDEILTEEVRKLNVIWNPTCRGYKDQNKKAAWKEVSTIMSGIDGKNLAKTITWSCSYKKVF